MWELAGQASRGGRWDFDYATGVIGWSSQLDQVFGINKQLFIDRGGDFAALAPQPWRDEVNASFRAARDSGVRDFRIQYPILRPDGTEIWIENSVVFRRDAGGAPMQAIGFLQDVTARMAAERAAQAANEAKSAFLATMSHEIRTPLNGVIGVVGALERTGLAPAQREMVELIRTSGETLERILSDILDLSRIESGRHVLEQAPFDLGAAAEAIRRLMSLRASEKGLELVSRIEVSGRHLGDETALRQIITNLLSNAVKFTAQGEVRLTVEARDASDGRDEILIEVSDTGIGFDAETGARLFQRFVQADGTIARSYGGSGLGLSICKGLIERMDGAIEAASTPGAGSTFTVRLRLERAAGENPRTLAPLEREDGEAGVGPMRILLAEDNPTNQRVVSLLLEPTGASITLTSNGLEALDAWRSAAFDLILMDMMMPEMDGLGATAAIRDLERRSGRARTPIAMLTANAMPDHVRAAMDSGCDSHIAKPLTPQRLFAGIEAALGHAAATAAAPASDAA
jgi:PAS domain S-box-containing protein